MNKEIFDWNVCHVFVQYLWPYIKFCSWWKIVCWCLQFSEFSIFSIWLLFDLTNCLSWCKTWWLFKSSPSLAKLYNLWMTNVRKVLIDRFFRTFEASVRFFYFQSKLMIRICQTNDFLWFFPKQCLQFWFKCLCAWLSLLTITKIFSTDFLNVFWQSHVKNRLSAFFNGSHEASIEKWKDVHRELIISPNFCVDCSRMKRIGSDDPCALCALRQFKCEQETCKLWVGIKLHRWPIVGRI